MGIRDSGIEHMRVYSTGNSIGESMCIRVYIYYLLIGGIGCIQYD